MIPEMVEQAFGWALDIWEQYNYKLLLIALAVILYLVYKT